MSDIHIHDIHASLCVLSVDVSTRTNVSFRIKPRLTKSLTVIRRDNKIQLHVNNNPTLKPTTHEKNIVVCLCVACLSSCMPVMLRQLQCSCFHS